MGFVGEKKHQNGDFMGIASEFGFYPNLTNTPNARETWVDKETLSSSHFPYNPPLKQTVTTPFPICHD